jgi:light-regulated signal transduction histidine kinase (bacteriophytochrome)
MLGKTIEQVSPEMIGTPFHQGLLQAAKDRNPQRFDYYHPPFDSWFEISAFPSREGVTVYARDITATKKSRKELETAKSQIEQMARDLERRVEDRTGQLHATIKELEAFSYSVSHDLRAPLRAIDGFSRMLQEDYYPQLDEEGRRILDVIRHNTVNMGNLIDGLLAFSRLGRQAIGETTINMTELAHDAMKEALGAETDRNIQFTVHELPAARGDRVLLRQVLVNLVANALKFSRDRNPAVIEIGSRSDDGFNVFFVRDNGVGFDMRYADKLFGVFQRLHAATEFEGTGLGLAIVQRIVARHGGRVWAEAMLNKGATIYFTLPKTGTHTIESADVETQRLA